jgi:glycosyltransferase involved in cell wall biosynthesis
MSANLVTLANFGRKQNFRTTDMLPIIETFIASGELRQIICQINAGYSFKNTVPAIPSIVRYPLRAWEKVTKWPFKRQTMDRLFDFFGAQRLARADVTFIHGGFFLPRITHRAQALNSTTVDISVSAHIAANAELEREELSLLGFPDYPGRYTKLTQDMTPLDEINYLILMSEFAKKTYLAAGYPADHIFIAHLDIDTKRFSPAARTTPNKPFRVLYMAYTQPLKGFHYLLDAWEQLHLPDAELVIVGFFSDTPEELRQQYLKRIERDKRITWLPNSLTPEDHFKEASVFVFPSLTEGFGRSTMEAMACGVPVITTPHAQGIVEDDKTGYVVPIRDVEAIKEKIEYLYHHRDVAEEMGKAARKAVENKKPFGEAVHEIYKEIMKREHRV